MGAYSAAACRLGLAFLVAAFFALTFAFGFVLALVFFAAFGLSLVTVPDFFTCARVRPTLFYTGSQAEVGDGHSRRIGMPIVRIRRARKPLTIVSLSHETAIGM